MSDPSEPSARGLDFSALDAAALQAADFDPTHSAGLFVGVRTFLDADEQPSSELLELPYAVDDAIDLAALFVFDLKLLEARRVRLLLSGEVVKQSTSDALSRLKAEGAKLERASHTKVLAQLRDVARTTGERGLLVVSFATHGYAQGGDRLLCCDSLMQDLEDTSLAWTKLSSLLEQSPCPRRLVLLDACRPFIHPHRAAVAVPPTPLAQAIASVKGLAVLSGAPPGGYCYDDPDTRNGAFTARVLEGLRTGAPADVQGFVTLSSLATWVDQSLKGWLKATGKTAGAGQGITLRLEPQGIGALPLAFRPSQLSSMGGQVGVVSPIVPLVRDALSVGLWTKPLKYTLEHTSYIELAGIRRIEGAFRLPLERVFVDLRADRSGPRGRGAGVAGAKVQPQDETEAELRHTLEYDRTVPLHEALRESTRAIFVGDPGSGKTTLLRFVARVVSEGLLEPGAPAERARALLGLAQSDPLPYAVRAAPRGRPSDLLGLAESDPLPYPLFTTLATLDHYLEERDIPKSKVTGKLMQGFLCSVLESAGLHLTLSELEQVIDAKRLLVLLDGFDEIPGHRERQRAAKGVKELLACCTSLRVLMTSRTRAFEAEVQGELGSLEPWRLQPMSDLELKRFLEVWFGAVHDTEPTKAAQVSAELYQELCQHPEVRRMATTPNVVTLMAILKHNQARLPKRRVELYREVIDLFLELKDVARGLEDTWKHELGVPFALDEKRDLLAALALEMHGGGYAGRTVAEDVVTECFALQFIRARSGWDEKTSRQKASRLLDLLQLRSGLLRKEEYGVQFSHLGLQEFLAAYALASELEEALWQKLEPRLKDDWWNEVIRLLVALKGRQSGPLLRRLANAGQGEAPDWEKAGRGIALALGGLGDLPTLHVSKPDEQKVRSKLELLVGKGTPVPVKSRIEALLALGRVGDPRLGMDNPDRWVWHPPGSFMMGSESGDSDERPIHRVHIRQGFWLGKYPVTVQEYAAFMEANGYQTRAWWSEAGWVYIQGEKRLAPRYWDAAEYSAPNQPVVWVSWHEAEAFCSWQNHRWVEAPPTRLLEGLKHVGSGSPVLRLPSESEWEYAARGEQSRTYPWGDTPEPDHELANFSRHIGRPTPVGAYPQGQSWAGAADLAGNVWEWCQDTHHDSYKGAPADCSAWTTGGDSAHRVIRGGSWWNDSGRLSGAGRDWGRPGAWNRGWGFRVVLASVPGGDHWHSIL